MSALYQWEADIVELAEREAWRISVERVRALAGIIRRLDAALNSPSGKEETATKLDSQGHPRIYPCRECGVMRSEPEGGTTFTVCDECWDKHHPSATPASEETEK